MESADLYTSLDVEEGEGYLIFGEEGSRIRAAYPRFILEYLLSDRDPRGIYVLSFGCTEAGPEDGRGVHVGMALKDLLEAVPELERVSGSDPVCFACALEDPGIEYLCTLGWDGRVSEFQITLLRTGDGE